jgi:hypothetical protein
MYNELSCKVIENVSEIHMLKLRNDSSSTPHNNTIHTNIPASSLNPSQPEDKSTNLKPLPNSSDCQNISEQKQDTDDNMDTFGTESNLNK